MIMMRFNGHRTHFMLLTIHHGRVAYDDSVELQRGGSMAEKKEQRKIRLDLNH